MQAAPDQKRFPDEENRLQNTLFLEKEQLQALLPKPVEPLLLPIISKSRNLHAVQARTEIKVSTPLVYSLDGAMSQELAWNHDETARAYATIREQDLKREIRQLSALMQQVKR